MPTPPMGYKLYGYNTSYLKWYSGYHLLLFIQLWDKSLRVNDSFLSAFAGILENWAFLHTKSTDFCREISKGKWEDKVINAFLCHQGIKYCAFTDLIPAPVLIPHIEGFQKPSRNIKYSSPGITGLTEDYNSKSLGIYSLQKHTTAHKNRISIPFCWIKLKSSKTIDIFRVQVEEPWRALRLPEREVGLEKSCRNLWGLYTMFPFKCFSTVLVQLKKCKDSIKKKKKKSHPFFFITGVSRALNKSRAVFCPPVSPFLPPAASYQLRFCSCSNNSPSVTVQPPRQDDSYYFTRFLML